MTRINYYVNSVKPEAKVSSAKDALAYFNMGRKIIKSTWVNGTGRPFEVAYAIGQSFGRECLKWKAA